MMGDLMAKPKVIGFGESQLGTSFAPVLAVPATLTRIHVVMEKDGHVFFCLLAWKR